MKIGHKGTQNTSILSEYYDTKGMNTLAEIIHGKGTEDSRTNIAFDNTLQMNEYNANMIVRPIFAWWMHALLDIWLTSQRTNEANRYTPMSLDNQEHSEIILQKAPNSFEDQQKGKKNTHTH